MRSVSPQLACGADEYTIAEDQLQFVPVIAANVIFSDGAVARVIRYKFSDDERRAIAEGHDIYFGTFAVQALQPHWIVVGDPTIVPT